jgi:8-oxo-dGTP pyrophosphatase MutT (NUDIX family)
MELRKLVGTRPLIMAGACVLLCSNQQLLLQRRTDNGCWGLPGGSMELGETLEEVAKRELFEETGVHANGLELFDMFSGQELYYKYPNGDEVYNVVAAYLCTGFDGALKKMDLKCKKSVFLIMENCLASYHLLMFKSL